MIITAGLVGIGLTLATYRYTNRVEIAKKKKEKVEETEFRNKFNTTMKYIGEKNKNEQTYSVLKYIPKKYGCDAIISIPVGLDYGKFSKLVSALRSSLGAEVFSNPASDYKTAYIRVVENFDAADSKDQIRFKWNTIMASNNKLYNQNYETYKITSIKEKEEYGFDVEITIPDGLDYPTLEGLQTTLENNFRGKIYQDYVHFDNKAKMTIVTKELPDDKKFEPVKFDVEELYLGMTYNYKPVTVDLKILSHMSYSGTTNTGKTICLLTALTNNIYWHDENKWDLFLSMISAKKDLKVFANVKQCKYFADTLEKALLMFKHLRSIMLQRNAQFEHDELIMNISEWNKKFPNRKMKPIIVATDEISFYAESSIDNERTANLKAQCRDIMFELYREGRSVGIHLLSSLQRPDRLSVPPEMKALIGAKVCFYLPNQASAKTALDTTEATTLRKQREAIVEGTDKVIMKTLYLTPEMIQEYIKHRIEPNHQHLNLGNQSNEPTPDNTSTKPTEEKKSSKKSNSKQQPTTDQKPSTHRISRNKKNNENKE